MTDNSFDKSIACMEAGTQEEKDMARRRHGYNQFISLNTPNPFNQDFLSKCHESDWVNFLRVDLALRPIWTQVFFIDLLIFMRNKHRVLSLMLAHDLHPFSRGERLLIFFSGLCCNFFVFSVANVFDGFLRVFALSLLSGLSVVLMKVMEISATCLCVQSHSRGVRTAAEFVGSIFVCILAMVDIVLLFTAIFITLSEDAPFVDIVSRFFIGELFSVLWDFLLLLLSFFWYFYSHEKHKQIYSMQAIGL